MNPPNYAKPYTIIGHSHTTHYGTLEPEIVERLEKAGAVDRARHMVEWLEYDLFLAREHHHEVYLKYSEEQYAITPLG